MWYLTVYRNAPILNRKLQKCYHSLRTCSLIAFGCLTHQLEAKQKCKTFLWYRDNFGNSLESKPKQTPTCIPLGLLFLLFSIPSHTSGSEITKMDSSALIEYLFKYLLCELRNYVPSRLPLYLFFSFPCWWWCFLSGVAVWCSDARISHSNCVEFHQSPELRSFEIWGRSLYFQLHWCLACEAFTCPFLTVFTPKVVFKTLWR